ncbi:MAG: DUF2851 family protein [Prevotellaceae bacterium]|jgi:hypothetical protein|nr:DUF2851 family protein [Prevotellaceae bacterium]
MEQLLHYVWKHKLFPLQPLQTTLGEPIEVIDTGLHNIHAGPDFFNAKLKIAGTLWVGNVEIHTRTSDWIRHGHQHDAAYNNVILHIAETVDGEATRANGSQVPQMQLSCPETIRHNYDELRRTEIYPPCYAILPALPKLTIHSWLSALQMERLEQKTQLIADRLARFQHNWEDVFFITLARNFGFGLNGDAFEGWASRLPFRAIDKHRDNLLQVEAFFFGQAGLLEEPYIDHEERHPATDKQCIDNYYFSLQKEFRYLQRKFDLTASAATTPWRFLRLRPGNFPHVRLAQLAHLYHTRRSLFSQVMEADTLDAVKRLFTTSTSPYWETHFNFRKLSPQRPKRTGNKALELIIINTVIPFLYAYGLHKANDMLCERAAHFLELLHAEDNHITRAWTTVGLPVSTAGDSQALLQLQKNYCDRKDCLRCRFGYEYLKGKRAR